MAERHRLGGLQMGEARHDAPRFLHRALGHGELQIGKLRLERVDLVADIETEVRRHLIIARARRVQAPGGRADELGKPGFDVHVNIFERARKLERAAVDLGADLRQAFGDLRGVFRRDDALLAQHRDMSERAADVLGPETLVEIDGDVDGLQNRVGCALEASAPYLARHLYPGACA